jgi:hypothetical protein
MARYKVTKEQLERVVESFVMENTKKSKNVISESDKKMIRMASKKYNITESEAVKRMELIREYDEKAFMNKFKDFAKIGFPKLAGREATEEEMNALEDEARTDNFEGDIKIKKQNGEYVMYYQPRGEVGSQAKKAGWLKRLGMIGGGAKGQ